MIKKVWSQIKIIQECFDQFKKTKWADINANDMVEDLKGKNKTLTQIKGVDKKSNYFVGVQNDIKNWLLFLPLVEELKDKSMNQEDDRHWTKIRKILDSDFKIQADTQLKLLWNL